MLTLLLLTLLLLLLVAYFSGVEIAFFTASRFRMELLSSQGDPRAQTLSRYMRQPARFISTLLVGLNVSLILYGMVTTRVLEPFLIKRFGWSLTEDELPLLLTQTLLSTALVLVMGEYLPKVFFSAYADRLLIGFAPLISLTTRLLSPLVWLIEQAPRALLGRGWKAADEQAIFSKQDLYKYMQESLPAEHETDTELDSEAFTNALELNKTRVRSFMVPRTEIQGLPIDASWAEARALFAQTEHSRLVVYGDTLDDVRGYVQLADVLHPVGALTEILRPIPLVPESMPAHLLLQAFRQKGSTFALVVDEFGGTAGLTTLEDLVEEIFGEIEDEHDDADDDELLEQVLPDGSYRLSGRLEVDYLNRNYGLAFPLLEDYSTLSGWVLYHCQRIPESGEELTLGPYRVYVEQAASNRLVLLRLSALEQGEED